MENKKRQIDKTNSGFCSCSAKQFTCNISLFIVPYIYADSPRWFPYQKRFVALNSVRKYKQMWPFHIASALALIDWITNSKCISPRYVMKVRHQLLILLFYLPQYKQLVELFPYKMRCVFPAQFSIRQQ